MLKAAAAGMLTGKRIREELFKSVRVNYRKY